MVYKDPSQNFIHEYPHSLEALFLPKSVAVVGAKDTPGSVGRTVMMNLISSGFPGTVVGVNPNRREVLGANCYPSLLAIPHDIDVAVIVVPAVHVLNVIRDGVEKRIKGAVIISAGFKEIGAEGLALEQEVVRVAKSGGIRIIGPNCLGIMNPLHGFNASFAKGMALTGSLAFISQSGAMCTAVLDWSLERKVGFSAFVSIGSMSDVNWGDLIEYFGQDGATRAILMYMETVGDAVSFMSLAKKVALDKPIIVIKPGRSQEAQKAASSHTGSLSGSDDVFEAACERAGVLRVSSISQLFGIAEVLDRQPMPKGPHLAIVTNAGGPSVLATDAAVEYGASIAPLSARTIASLHQFLPPAWSHGNPVDILGDAPPERYQKAVDVLMKDEGVDGVLAILSPQDMTDPVGTSALLEPYAGLKIKPLIASWMGGASVEEGRRRLSRANIPSFEYPDDAAWSFAVMWQHSQRICGLYETPLSDIEGIEKLKEARYKASHLLKEVSAAGRTLLSEEESKRLFQFYGIPVVETMRASSAQEAVQIAKRIGYPVVVKLHSETITHKSDIGGVQLNLGSEEAVRNAFDLIQSQVVAVYGKEAFHGVTVQKMVVKKGIELIVGSSLDPQFGPILLFGAGGIYVEIMKDRALGFPPLNSTQARHMIEKTKIAQALGEFRGKKGASLDEVAKILVRFSEMIVENREIVESDINPILATEDGALALDARCVIAAPGLRVPKTAIRSYPMEYVEKTKLKNGQEVLIRPIRPEDEPMMVEFHKAISENSVRQRYFEFVELSARVSHERLLRICSGDFEREMALVAEASQNGKRVIIGVIRLIKALFGGKCDLKMVIIDEFHHQGLGTILLKMALNVATREEVEEIHVYVLEENIGMLKILERNGFQKVADKGEGVVEFSSTLAR